MDFLAFLAGLFKSIAAALGMIQQNKDQATGSELQRGADAEKAYADAQAALKARDAVVPDVRGPDGYRLPDGSPDPDQRD